MPHAKTAAAVDRGEMHFRREVVVSEPGKPACTLTRAKRGAWLNGQLVKRQMFGTPAKRFLEFSLPVGERLVLSGVHQVNTDPAETPRGSLEGATGGCGGVQPAQCGEVSVAQRLDSDR